MPQGFLTKEEQTRASQLQPQLENIVNQYTMNWILDGGADEQWDEYVSALKNAGLDEFVKNRFHINKVFFVREGTIAEQ